MTEDQKLRAELLRIDGKSPWEISEIIGVSLSDVENNKTRKYKVSIVGAEMSVFPELNIYMQQHGMTKAVFSDFCGIKYSTMLDILMGDFPPSKQNIDKILAATGLTYEVAFREVRKNDQRAKGNG